MKAETTFEYSPDEPIGDGEKALQTFYGQDRVVWETQGQIFDRSLETLGASDRGIVMFRGMLADQIDRVERGEAPTIGVVQDESANEMIKFVSATRPRYDDERHVFDET